MRVLQVVTLVTPDGAFGGPVRVAFNLARELDALGHDVTVAGATRGYDPVPTRMEGVRVRLWRARQVIPFADLLGVFIPELLAWMWRNRRVFDVVHVHMARDMVTLPAAALALVLRKRLVLQTHGMVVESGHWFAPVLDFMLTRPVLRRADAVLFLTEEERLGLEQVSGRARLHQLLNGVPAVDRTTNDGQTLTPPEILFLARLQERKRPQLFVEAAGVLLAEGVQASFALVGRDQGEGANVRRAIQELGDDGARVRWEGSLPPDATLARMRRASGYVLPSVNEPFPMSVLEAMSVGLPVVVTQSCGLADVIQSAGCGLVVDETKESLVEAMRRLVLDAEMRNAMSSAAIRAVQDFCDMTTIANTLVDIYQRDGPGSNPSVPSAMTA